MGESLSLAPGTKLGTHEIVELIGEGGMGQVYRARDASLGRDVAVKVLPEALAADAERVGRFRREAQLLAALTHQNVAAIHGFDDDGDRHYLVMELVEGEPLDRRLRQGPLETTAALEVARQVAEGLEAAHAKGIVHRDLKPGNVIVKPDGQVKVLDFGLAKALSDAPESSSALGRSPTLITAETAQGVLLGTAAYMSPEQARGQAVDARADNWAFGALLYEMLSGKRVFDGGTVSDCLALVLQGEPDWSALPDDTPPAIRLLLRRCLTKDPRRRLHSIADARIEIESVLADPSGSTAMLAADAAKDATSRVAKGWGGAAVLLVAVLAAAVGAVAAWTARAPEPLEVDRFVLTLDDPERGSGQGLAVSPDGRSLAYLQERGDRLAVLSLETGESTILPGVDSGFLATYSPDGSWIAYKDVTRDQIRRVSARGGPSTVLIDPSGWVIGMAVHRDGSVFLARGEGGPPVRLMQVAAGGGEPEPVAGFEDVEVFLPSLSTDGSVLFVTTRPREKATTPYPERCRIEALRLSDGRRRVVLEGATGPRWSPSGHVVAVAAGGALTAVPFDLERLEVSGEPVVVEGQARLLSRWRPTLGIGADGTLVYQTPAAGASAAPLSWLALDGTSTPLELPARFAQVDDVRLSPDGRAILAVENSNETSELWLHALDGSRTERFGEPGVPWDHGIWSPDGRWLFASLEPLEREQAQSLWRFDRDHSSPPQKLLEAPAHLIPLGVTADGRRLIYSSKVWESELAKAMLLDLETLEVEEWFSGEGSRLRGRLSPDGRWFASWLHSSGQQRITVRPVGRSGGALVLAAARQCAVVGWSADSSRVFYWLGDFGTGTLRATTLETEPELKAGEVTTYLEDFTDLWRVEEIDAENGRLLWGGELAAEPDRFIMVRNFDEHLRRVAPPSR